MRLLILFLLFVTFACNQILESKPPNNLVEFENKSNFNTQTSYKRLQKKKAEALNYCKKNKLNTNLCFLLDMKIHSGKKRFFVYDFIKDSVIKKALVSHGCGKKNWAANDSKDIPKFSNVPESHLSSLGKYKIGKRGWSNWGIHVNYLLHGLDTTNNNALKRQIVLHGWNLVTDDECFPNGTAEGWGCPAVSNNFMTYLDSTLKKQNQSVLLWMY
jgi:hypothetical protein